MELPELHRLAVGLVFAFAAVTFLLLFFVTAPYGRHVRKGWGPTMPARVAWVVMELPACIGFAAIYLAGPQRAEIVPLILFGLWQWHYVQRTFTFPFRIRVAKKRLPVLIPFLGFTFNLLNAWVNAVWISRLGDYGREWLQDPRLWLGTAIFFVGWGINRRHDTLLIALRKPGESDYRIPHGGLFRWVSAPNYLGELIEWTGWAIAGWSLGGLAFAIYTAANLAPRALANHRWYREKFPDYPRERKALIPFVV